MQRFSKILDRLKYQLFALLLIAPFKSFGAVDPEIQWNVKRTDHFDVIYDSRQENLANTYAKAAERSYSLLIPIFKEAPNRTILILSDSSDAANGYASIFPYPLIQLFPVLPSQMDSISHYGFWPEELILHEYTHILNMEPASGFYTPLKYIFGSLIHPNALLPRWYSEGLAVVTETWFSRHGRLRSPYQFGVLRAMVADDTLKVESIDRINESSIPSWPLGQRPYLFGAMVMDELISRGGLELLGALNENYSTRVPYFLNGPVEDRLELTYSDLYDSSRKRYEGLLHEQIQKIREDGETPFESIVQKGHLNHSPALSPSGTLLAFIENPEDGDSQIRLLKRDNLDQSFDGASIFVHEARLISKVSWAPSSKSLVFDATNNYKGFYQYSDLYRFDLEEKRATRLTFGMRAHEPSFSPDSQSIAFVQKQGGDTSLAVIDQDGKNLQVLYTQAGARISRPEFISNEKIAFSERLNGQEELLLLDLETKSARPVLRSYNPIQFPKMTSQGLLFVSEQSGVPNLYLSNTNMDQATPITNTVTLAMAGEIDPHRNELYYGQMQSDGVKIVKSEIPKTPPSHLPELKEVSSSLWSSPPSWAEPSVEFHEETFEYSPWRHLIPRYWFPFIYFVPGGAGFEFSTGASDPLAIHKYGLSGGVDSLTEKFSGALSYTYSYGRTKTLLLLSDNHVYYYGLDLSLQSTSATLGFLTPVGKDDTNWSMGFSVQYRQTDAITTYITRVGPGLSFLYSDIKAPRGSQISPVKGKSLEATYTNYLPEWGNRRTTVTATHYFSSLFPKNHVLFSRAHYVYAPKNPSQFIGVDYSVGEISNRTSSDTFLMRGYLTGQFHGHEIANLNLEYRFPLFSLYRGFGTKPFFFHKAHLAVIADGVTLNGESFSKENGYTTTQLGRIFTGVGTEFKADVTLGYHLPVQFSLGLYYGLDREAMGEPLSYLGILIEQ